MKRFFLLSLFLSIPLLFNLKSYPAPTDYRVNFGLKNLMQDKASGVNLKYLDAKDTKSIPTEGYDLGEIQPSSLTEPGKLYVNVLTLGTAQRPSSIRQFTVTYRPSNGVCSGKTDVGGFCIVQSGGWSLKDPLHGVILPNGKIVQVAQLFNNGGIQLLDGYMIHSDGHVTHSVNDPKSTIPVPAGKTKPVITESGTLGWE